MQTSAFYIKVFIIDSKFHSTADIDFLLFCCLQKNRVAENTRHFNRSRDKLFCYTGQPESENST